MAMEGLQGRIHLDGYPQTHPDQKRLGWMEAPVWGLRRIILRIIVWIFRWIISDRTGVHSFGIPKTRPDQKRFGWIEAPVWRLLFGGSCLETPSDNSSDNRLDLPMDYIRYFDKPY
jgi:hypothetical protein